MLVVQSIILFNLILVFQINISLAMHKEVPSDTNTASVKTFDNAK